MGKPAVPAPDGKVPATDAQIMGTSDMTVPASGCFDKLPEIITADIRERSFFTDILDPGDENPGCAAVIAGNLCLVWYSFDDLVSIFLTVIAVCTVPREDETLTHGR